MSKPKRDANVTDLEPVKQTPSAPSAEQTPPGQPEGDVPMPTVENEPAMVFRPGAGCSILDVYEVCLMTLLVLSNSSIQFAPGALRNIQIPAEKAAMLSSSSLRFMQPVQVPAADPAPSEPPKS